MYLPVWNQRTVGAAQLCVLLSKYKHVFANIPADLPEVLYNVYCYTLRGFLYSYNKTN